MIHLSESAAGEFRRLMAQRGLQEATIRIGVETGGCSGLQYNLDFAGEISAEDVVFDREDGLRVVCNREAMMYLDGLNVDFSSKLMGGGFRFANPNAARSCGCGTSFRI
ncbi:MAG: iron-sulfur cluster assembly accessory protein [Candidatus Krumholzibacteria bacterium]|nr:iron-sulfur cluster assembly accessory protein [Candidatus Krumholzibacteria bacterium]